MEFPGVYLPTLHLLPMLVSVFLSGLLCPVHLGALVAWLLSRGQSTMVSPVAFLVPGIRPIPLLPVS